MAFEQVLKQWPELWKVEMAMSKAVSKAGHGTAGMGPSGEQPGQQEIVGRCHRRGSEAAWRSPEGQGRERALWVGKRQRKPYKENKSVGD